MEAIEPTRPIIVRQGSLQQQQQRSSTWASFAPSWVQTGIQTLKQTVFGSSDAPSQDTSESLLGKRSEPADDRDPGPAPKRARRESPSTLAFSGRSDSMEPQPSCIQYTVRPLRLAPCFRVVISVGANSTMRLLLTCPLCACSTKYHYSYLTFSCFPPLSPLPTPYSDLAFHHQSLPEPLPHTLMPTLPRTQATSSQDVHQSVHRSSPAIGHAPLGPTLAQNYLANPSTHRRQRLGAPSSERRPATATFASNNAIPPRAASQVGLSREYSFQGYRAVSSGPSSGTDTDRTSPSRQPSTITRAKIAPRAPSFGPNPVRTPKCGHVFGKSRSTSPIKPTLDRPAGTGWASGIVRTERERIRVGSFVNIPYEVRFSFPFSLLFAHQSFINNSRPTDLPFAIIPNLPWIPKSALSPTHKVHPGCQCPLMFLILLSPL